MRIVIINSLISIAYWIFCKLLFVYYIKDVSIGTGLLFLIPPNLYAFILLVLGSIYFFKKDKKGLPFIISSAIPLVTLFVISGLIYIIEDIFIN